MKRRVLVIAVAAACFIAVAAPVAAAVAQARDEAARAGRKDEADRVLAGAERTAAAGAALPETSPNTIAIRLRCDVLCSALPDEP